LGDRPHKKKRLAYGKHKKIWNLEKKKHSKKSYRRLIMKKESIIINDINIE